MSQSEEGAWHIKRRLISQAQSIAYNGDLRKGHDEIQALRESWKSAGRAGTDSEGNNVDDVLYREFKQACDNFYERRARARENAIAVKRTIVYEMSKLVGRPYERSVGEESRALMTRWKEAPRAPKAEEDQMWHELNKYRDQIAEARERASAEHRQRKVDFLDGKLSNKQSYLSDLQSKLYAMELNWRYSDFTPPSINSRRYDEIMAKRREKESQHYDRVGSLRSKIETVESEIRALEAEIYELRSAR